MASYAFEPHTVYSFAIYILFINVDLDEFQVGVWKDCLQIPKDLSGSYYRETVPNVI
jgi:hypothetical protein